jgi:hypothetical protein
MKLTVTESVSLDGVMQGLGNPTRTAARIRARRMENPALGRGGRRVPQRRLRAR